MIRSIALLVVGFSAVFAQQYYSTPGPFAYSTPQYPYPYQVKAIQPAVVPVPSVKFVPAPPAKVVVPVAPPSAPLPGSVHVQPVAYAQPAAYPQVRSGGVLDKDAHIVQGFNDVEFDGNFAYGFDSDNGISVKAKGFVKPPPAANEEPIQVIEGSYTYYDHEGKPVSIAYVADENGFRASGDAIPQPHEAIAKALKYQLENPSPARK